MTPNQISSFRVSYQDIDGRGKLGAGVEVNLPHNTVVSNGDVFSGLKCHFSSNVSGNNSSSATRTTFPVPTDIGFR